MFGSQRQLETRDYTSPSKGGYRQFTIHGLLVSLVHFVCLVYSVYLVHLVYLVYLVYSVYLVCLVYSVYLVYLVHLVYLVCLVYLVGLVVSFVSSTCLYFCVVCFVDLERRYLISPEISIPAFLACS